MSLSLKALLSRQTATHFLVYTFCFLAPRFDHRHKYKHSSLERWCTFEHILHCQQDIHQCLKVKEGSAHEYSSTPHLTTAQHHPWLQLNTTPDYSSTPPMSTAQYHPWLQLNTTPDYSSTPPLSTAQHHPSVQLNTTHEHSSIPPLPTAQHHHWVQLNISAI